MIDQQKPKYEYKLWIASLSKEHIDVVTDFMPLLNGDINPDVESFKGTSPILLEAEVLYALMDTNSNYLITKVEGATTLLPMSYIQQSIVSCKVREYIPKK